jgi:DNA modification methylase
MAIANQKVTDRYAIYDGDCCEVLPGFPEASIHFSVYSPPFGGLYNYSSSPRDLSNAKSYQEFFEHYEFVVGEMLRVTMPGRLSAVHVKDVPRSGTAGSGLRDFPGDVIRLHEKLGWLYHDRKCVWKEPLKEAIRTRALGLRHGQLVRDSAECRSALADYIVVFRRKGENKIPIAHPYGLSDYAGDWSRAGRPGADGGLAELRAKYCGWTDQKTNKLSHWIWQRYASAFWDDVRIDRVLPYKAARDKDDEKHIHPLQLDVIERCLVLWSNSGETVLTPFMGVGSEVYAAVANGRRGIGIELKPSYYRQALLNIEHAAAGHRDTEEQKTFEFADESMETAEGGMAQDFP